MRILFDNGTPRGIAGSLTGHVVEEARSRGWDTLRNGDLIRKRLPEISAAVTAAEPGSFSDVQIPVD